MALLPPHSSAKRRLFAATRPNYKDFSSPPNGDYVRYVEGLMAWAEQEQERARLKALGKASQATPDAAWGRTSAGAAASRALPSAAQTPGRADKPWSPWVRKAQAHVQNLQQQAAEMAAAAGEVARTAETLKPVSKPEPTPSSAKGSPLVMWMFGLVFIVLVILDWFEF